MLWGEAIIRSASRLPAPRREAGGPRRRRRLMLVGALIPVLAGCSIGTSSAPTPTPRIIVTNLPGKSPTAAPAAVSVLTPLGLNVRQSADLQSAKVATLAQGAQLDLLESRQVSGQPWLHIRSQSGTVDGWVLDSPELVIHRVMSQHLDTGWSILFPDKWVFKEGNPASFTSPPSDPDGALLIVQTADDAAKLPSTPITAGKELRAEAPIEVYGKTTFITIYQLDSGGFEFATQVKNDAKKGFLFDYKQSPRAEADTTLFKQLLASVILS